jgi:uncharacterized protein (DUF1330 family)
MKTRLINAGIFLLLFLMFLSWYDGWGKSPLTQGEIDEYIANITDEAALSEMKARLRTMATDDDGTEFFMLNLNRYDYATGESEEDVPAAYQAYSEAVISMVLKNAGHPVYLGKFPAYQLVGDSAEANWHSVILVRYRSRRDFISMVTSDAYQDIAEVRAGGIDYAEVTPTLSGLNISTPRLMVFLLLLVPALLVDRVLKRRA